VAELSFKERLNAVREEVSYLQKGGFNEHFKYAFVQEAAVKAALSPALTKHRLCIGGVSYDSMSHPFDSGSCAVRCSVVIADLDGTEFVVYQGVGGGVDKGDKAPMKACAAALKYAVMSGFLIATGDDPEADDATDKRTSKKDAEPKAPATKDTAKRRHGSGPLPAEGAVTPETAPANEVSRVEKALLTIAATTEIAALTKLKLPIQKLRADTSNEEFERVRLAYVARAKELTPKEAA